jgi:hypothetical protein
MKRRVARLSVIVAAASILAVAFAYAQDSDTKAAQTSTEEWLALVDGQNYAASWDAAAAGFRARITREQWDAAVQGARAPLGAMKSRTLKSATATTTLPGAPDGQYVVFQFTSSFEHKAAALETATAVREADGTWRVGGYFVR